MIASVIMVFHIMKGIMRLFLSIIRDSKNIPSMSILGLGVFFFILSCSSADPIIYDFKWQLQALQDQEGKSGSNIKERLLIQLLADDDDGFEELYEIYVINDKSELYWRIISDEWKTVYFDQKQWILLSNIEVNDFTSLPRGEYRILLRDLSGYSDEKSFMLNDNVKYSNMDFPTVKRAKQYSITPYFESSKNTSYVGDEAPISQLFQIVYSSNENSANKQQIQRGSNGALYTIQNKEDIYFLVVGNTSFETYVHKIVNPSLILTSGPHIFSFSN